MWKSAIARAKRLRDHGRKSEPIVKKENHLWKLGTMPTFQDSDHESNDASVQAEGIDLASQVSESQGVAAEVTMGIEGLEPAVSASKRKRRQTSGTIKRIGKEVKQQLKKARNQK